MFKICKIYRHEEESVSLATLEKIIASGVKLTPMMQQYYSIKKIYSDLLLLFRMGDFYEVFFDDAKETAKLLNITLTHRGKLGDFPIPMAGIPHHAASTYIDKLTAQGKKVAICEQLEDPGQAKGIVKRGVSQIVGPCIPYDLDKLSPKESHYLMALGQGAGSFALVALDFTTGEFFGHLLSDHSALSEKIASLRPKELLTYFGQWEEENFLPANLPTIIQNINALETFLCWRAPPQRPPLPGSATRWSPPVSG